MNTTTLRWRRVAVSIAGIALTGCAEGVGPEPQPAIVASPKAASHTQAPDLGSCGKLAVTDGKVVFHVYATGVQIYRWSGSAWTLYGPDAVLTSDAAGNSVVGTHYVGPTWETVSGSKVVGAVVDRCTPNPNAIAWLLLSASSNGSGVFNGVRFIQRVNTVGGVAPSTPGGSVGDETRIPYSTEYFFYR